MPGHRKGPKQPIDAITTFITAEEVIGRPFALEEFNAAISSASPTAFLKALAGLLATLETTSIFNRQFQHEVASRFLVGAALNRASAQIDLGRIFLVPQVILVAMKAALLLAPEDGADEVTAASLITVLLFIGGALGGSRDDLDEKWHGFPREVSLELIRNQNFNSSVKLPSLVARFWRIWRELPADLKHQGAPRPFDDFTGEVGCRPEELMLFGLWLWMAAQNGVTHLPPEWLGQIPITSGAKSACMALMALPTKELAARAGSESVINGIQWTFLAFRERPLAQMPDGSILILSPRFVAERAFGGAMYWTLNERANRLDGDVINGPAWQAFRNLHADCIERYAEGVVAAWRPVDGDKRLAFSEEDMLRAWGRGVPVSDVALDYDWAWACIEISSRRLGLAAATGAGPEEMDNELKLMVEEKAGRQLHSTVERLRAQEHALSGRDGPVRRYFPIMFVAHGFPTNPLTVDVIRETLRAKKLLQGRDTAPLEIVDLDELDLLDAVREQTGQNLVQLLRDKHDSAFFRSSIADFLWFEKEVRVTGSRRLDTSFHAGYRAALAASTDPSLLDSFDKEWADRPPAVSEEGPTGD